jgi:KaiC/GvpD/RAD55 family RecA-like ATPase/DNA-binding NarL/FixJ family response regulator
MPMPENQSQILSKMPTDVQVIDLRQPWPSEPTPTLSTGVEAVDARIRGVVPGRHYLVTGSPGAGKTTLGLHFLAAGLAAGETCAILTQDDPEDVMLQGEFMGLDLRAAAEEERLIVLRYRLDFARNYARASDPAAMFAEFRSLVADTPPTRLLIDSLLPFLERTGSGASHFQDFPDLLEELGCTTYFIAPGELSEGYYRRLYDRIVSNAGGILHLDFVDGQTRRLTVRKMRHPVKSTDPVPFAVRPGAGLVESIDARDELPESIRRKVVLLTDGMMMPDELVEALRQKYELRQYDSIRAAFSELGSGRYGALVVGLNPRDVEPAFDLARELRRAGNGAPILFVSTGTGLRGSDRARGLRAGGDDFLTEGLSPGELLERVEAARSRGRRRPQNVSPEETLVAQPEDEEGAPVPMSEQELMAVVGDRIRTAAYPFFALVRLHPQHMSTEEAWEVLSRRLRIREGDLIARGSGQELVIYLHDVRLQHVNDLFNRLAESHPGIGGSARASVYCYPVDKAEIEQWLAPEPAPTPLDDDVA